MNVLVTGANGNLGRVVVPALRQAGYEVRTLDFRGGDIVGDVRNPDDIARALRDIEAVVHAAALHGVHLDAYTPHEFWDTNVTGTFNVFESGRSAALSRVVLCSTMGVYGRRVDEATTIDDNTEVAPSNVYGMSKLLSEEIARSYARAREINTVALRLGMFVPDTWERYGFRLLFGGVDDRDVADVVVRALDYDPPGGFDAMNVMANVPFDDPVEFARKPESVIEKYWPGTSELGFDISELVWGTAIWRSEKARRLLGWRPSYGFGEFLEAHRRGDRSHYPFAGLPQWGLP